jgi:hypothetical protein
MNIKPIVRRESFAAKAEASAPMVDQSVIDSFVQIQDPKPVAYTKPTLEELLLTKYRLTPENYSEDLKWIISTLNEYVKVMSIGTNSTETQHGIQVGKLLLAYVRALRNSDSVMLFDAILWFFSYYEDTVFRAELPYRGMRMFKFGTNEQTIFYQHITSIAQELADMQTRNQRLRDLDFKGAIKNVPKSFEKQQAGLTSFIEFYTNF